MLYSRTRIDPDDVVLSKSWGTSQGRKVPSNSRVTIWTSYTLEVVHLPTNIRALGEVPQGCYSKAKMSQLRQQLYHRLVEDLARKVTAYSHYTL